MARVFLIGTYQTKGAELGYLADALTRAGLQVTRMDLSLNSSARLPGPEKLARMEARAREIAAQLVDSACDHSVAVGVGGGTGSEIVIAALKGLPARYPKLLVTTLPFDPRAAVADTAITLIPTLCDIEGLNPSLRQVFEKTARMAASLTDLPEVDKAAGSVAVTTLGATGQAGQEAVRLLGQQGIEPTVFHANGYGGAAFARFLAEDRAKGVLDLNVHELGRLRLAGAHVPMPDRFSAASHLPTVVLPGALNFIGLGEIDTLSPEHRARAHYRHSGYFTHVKLTEAEMADQADALGDLLNARAVPAHVLIPMGGFSHEDRAGGAIEDETLRAIAAERLEARAKTYRVTRIDAHINAPETAALAVDLLTGAMSERMPA